MPASTYREVLDFWFGTPNSPDYGQSRPMWFRKSDAFDAELTEKFGPLVAQALDGQLDHWSQDRADAEPPLAFILLLDQMTRNIHRGTPRMFAGDGQALLTARAMVAAGQDQGLLPVQRQFCYLPFEHAEDRAAQAESLRLFEALKAFPATADVHQWAVSHAVIIERFGRYPHRNEVLGRPSTPDELEFLKQPGSSF
mgnify:FL=1|tara:strand:- start:21 stop:611 length:591 start_codon:yes stop_codon:yes gene_type:complete